MKASLSHLLIVTGSLICFTLLHADNENPSLETEAAPLADAQKQNPPMQKMPSREKSCKMANNPHRIDIKHIEAKGIGYNTGYTSLDAFFTSLFWENYVPFFDARAHIFNDGRWAANAGIGARYIFDPCQWMVGGNVYYDYRGTKHGNYNQIGAGIEAFYDMFEVHLNGYLPVGQKRTRTQQNLESVTFKGFSGNYILQNENYNNTYEGAMKGFNGELGAHIAGNRKCYDLYFGVGPYYYDVSSGKHAWGGKARLKAEVTKYLFLEVSDSYDRIFHNRVQGTVNVSIPFGDKLCYPTKSTQQCSNVMDWQAVLPVERQEIIVVSKFKKNQTIDPVAINPTTGQPYFVIFVNNTNTQTGGGSGTYEDPYAFLTNNDDISGIHNAENALNDGNIAYVFSGDGSATGMSGGGMQLQPNNRLLGSANSHPFQTTKGLLTVPALTAVMPNVQGQSTGPNANSIILLATDCEVSGLNISFPTFSAAGHGLGCILGNSGVLLNLNINNNNLVNETFGLGVTTIMAGNTIIANNTSSGHGSSGGSYFFTNAINGKTTITNNVSTNNVSTSIGIVASMNGSMVYNITNNVIENGSIGIYCRDSNIANLPQRSVIKGNIVNNTSAQSFILTADLANKPLTYIVENNTFINGGAQSSIVTLAATTPCVRFNNNTGYPSQFVGNPFLINGGSGGTIDLESPMNNYPQPSTSGTIVVEPACFCGQPCN